MKYGTEVHHEFDHYLWAQRCVCGAHFMVDDFPVLMCTSGHMATLGFTYREAIKPPGERSATGGARP